MQLKISLISGNTIEIEVDANGNVFDIKKSIAREKNTDPNLIKLLFNRKMLQNEQTIKELNITEESKIIMMQLKNPIPEKKPETESTTELKSPLKLTSPKKSPRTAKTPESDQNKPRASPLPLLNSNTIDPPDFEQKVKSLEEMGYDYRDCCQALRAAMYSLEMASDFLLAGHIPDAPVIPQSPTHATIIHQPNPKFNLDSDEENEEEEEPLVTPQIIQELYANPHKINEFLDKLLEVNPDNAFIIRNNPALVLAQIGIDPSKFDLSRYQNKTMYSELMEKFTPEEQDSIKRIAEKGYDTMMVIQFFEACDKNEEMTLQCLGSN